MQALAFVPVADVIYAFETLKANVPASFKPIMLYFEKNYVGRLKANSKTFIHEPRFPVES